MAKKFRFTPFSLFVSIIAAIGGLLFGFNTAVVSGALIFLEEDFQLTILLQELIVSIILIGALIGACIGGLLADKIGRKPTLMLTSILFVIGSFLLTTADAIPMLFVGRGILGLSVGVVSVVVPLYIAEMSDPTHRGTLVSLNQLGVACGILLAYIINFSFADSGEWRSMFGFGIIPAVVLFIGMFFIPETPSHLANIGKKVKAKKILKKIRVITSDEEVVLKAKKSTTKAVGWSHVFHKSLRGALFVGIGLSIFQQITGINTIIYYAPQIFQKAGFETASTAILASMSIGVMNVIMTFVALWLIDIVGRRPLLLTGIIGMIVSLLVLGFAFIFVKEYIGITSVISLMCYVSFFAIGLGPIVWLIISEIYPLEIRGRAMGVAIFFNWAANYIVSLTFLTLIQFLGAAGAFWFYAAVGVFALWFVFKKVPETKNKTFEQVQKFFKKKAKC